MAPTRDRDAGKASKEPKTDSAIKKRKGFSVGPANLPDGTYRRKSERFSSFWNTRSMTLTSCF